MKGWVELDSLPSKTSPLRLREYWTLNSYSQVLTEPELASLGSSVASTRRRPIALKMTPVNPSYTYIDSTAIGSSWCKLILDAVCSCASFHCWPIQVYPSKSINKCAIPNQTPTITKREHCYTYHLSVTHLLQLT